MVAGTSDREGQSPHSSQVAMKEPVRKDAVLIPSKLYFQLGLSSIFQ